MAVNRWYYGGIKTRPLYDLQRFIHPEPMWGHAHPLDPIWPFAKTAVPLWVFRLWHPLANANIDRRYATKTLSTPGVAPFINSFMPYPTGKYHRTPLHSWWGHFPLSLGPKYGRNTTILGDPEWERNPYPLYRLPDNRLQIQRTLDTAPAVVIGEPHAGLWPHVRSDEPVFDV